MLAYAIIAGLVIWIFLVYLKSASQGFTFLLSVIYAIKTSVSEALTIRF